MQFFESNNIVNKLFFDYCDDSIIKLLFKSKNSHFLKIFQNYLNSKFKFQEILENEYYYRNELNFTQTDSSCIQFYIYYMYLKNYHYINLYHAFHSKILLNQFILKKDDFKISDFSSYVFSHKFLMETNLFIIKKAYEIYEEVSFMKSNEYKCIYYRDVTDKKDYYIYRLKNERAVAYAKIYEGDFQDSEYFQEVDYFKYYPNGYSYIMYEDGFNCRITYSLEDKYLTWKLKPMKSEEHTELKIHYYNYNIYVDKNLKFKEISTSYGTEMTYSLSAGPYIFMEGNNSSKSADWLCRLNDEYFEIKEYNYYFLYKNSLIPESNYVTNYWPYVLHFDKNKHKMNYIPEFDFYVHVD